MPGAQPFDLMLLRAGTASPTKSRLPSSCGPSTAESDGSSLDSCNLASIVEKHAPGYCRSSSISVVLFGLPRSPALRMATVYCTVCTPSLSLTAGFLGVLDTRDVAGNLLCLLQTSRVSLRVTLQTTSTTMQCGQHGRAPTIVQINPSLPVGHFFVYVLLFLIPLPWWINVDD